MGILADFYINLVRNFTGREWVFQRLEAWLADSQGERRFWISGGRGTGKTSVAVRLALMLADQAPGIKVRRMDPSCPAYFHFCREGREETLSPRRFVEALSLRLAQVIPPYAEALTRVGNRSIKIETRQEVEQVAPGGQVTGVLIERLEIGNLSPRVAFEDLLRNPLAEVREKISASQPAFLVVVDAVDETLPEDPLAEFVDLLQLLERLPIDVRLVLTALPDERIVRRLGKPDLDLVKDAPLDEDDIKTFALQKLERFPESQREPLAARISQESKGIFLYAQYVLQDLLKQETLPEDIEHFGLPKDLEGVYLSYLERELTRNVERWEERYRPVLGLLSVARGEGLSLETLSGVSQVAPSRMADVLRACEQLLWRPDENGPVRLYHPSFRDFLVRNRDYPVYLAEASQQLAEYYLAEHRDAWLACADAYALANVAVHLLEASRGAASRVVRQQLGRALVGLFSDLTYLEARVRSLGGYPRDLLNDLETASGMDDLDAPDKSNLLELRKLFEEKPGLSSGELPATFCAQVLRQARLLGSKYWETTAQKRLDLLQAPYLVQLWSTSAEASSLQEANQQRFPMEHLSRRLTGEFTRLIQASQAPGGEEETGAVPFRMKVQTPSARITWEAQLHLSPGGDSAGQVTGLEGRADLRTAALKWQVELAPGGTDIYDATSPLLLNGRIELPSAVYRWDSQMNPSWNRPEFSGSVIPLQALAFTPYGILRIQLDEERCFQVFKDLLGETGRFEIPYPDQIRSEMEFGGQLLTWDDGTGMQLKPYRHELRVGRPERNWEIFIHGAEVVDSNIYSIEQRVNAIAGKFIGVTASFSFLEDPGILGRDWAGFLAEAPLIALPGGQQVLAAQSDGSLLARSLENGKMLYSLNGHHAPIVELLHEAGDGMLFSLAVDGSLFAWDMSRRSKAWSAPASQAVLAMTIASQSRLLAAARADGWIRSYDLKSGKPGPAWQACQSPAYPFRLHWCSRRGELLTADSAGKLKRWRLESGELLDEWEIDGTPVTSLIVLVDESWISAGTLGGTFVNINLESGALHEHSKGELGAAIIQSHPIGDTINLTSDARSRLRLWVNSPPGLEMIDSGVLPCFRWSLAPDGRHLAGSDLWRNKVHYLELGAAGAPSEHPVIQAFKQAELLLDHPARMVVIAPDNHTLLVGQDGGQVTCLRLVIPS